MSKQRLVLAALAWLMSVAVASAQQATAEQTREQWQRADEVVKALAIGTGSRVADVGAGSGFYTMRLSPVVGETGRVYAVDVNPVSLRELRSRLESAGLSNVEVIRGEEDDPKLPQGQLDAALIVNAYHEMAEYRAMLAAIRRALKPGGRLVLLEPGTRSPGDSREALAKRHQFSISLAEADLTEAGFEVVRREPEFAQMPPHNHEGEGTTTMPPYWLLVARHH
jgi:ubiquinone/menaquinone biosynthesis C-methylase UbiE